MLQIVFNAEACNQFWFRASRRTVDLDDELDELMGISLRRAK
jgi:hypothetical protein